VATVEEANDPLGDDRRGHGVDVAARGAEASGVRSVAYDDLDDELLGRATVVVDRPSEVGSRRRGGRRAARC
jgi:hypothetical protein